MTVKLGHLVAWVVNGEKKVTGRECSKTEFKRGDCVLVREPVSTQQETQAYRTPEKELPVSIWGAMQSAYISLINCINKAYYQQKAQKIMSGK